MKIHQKYVICFIALFAFMLLISKISGNQWEHKTQCYEPMDVPITELFFTTRKIIWDKEERSKMQFLHWNVPTITYIKDMDGEYEAFLRNLGVEGYINASSTLSSEKPWFRENMTAKLKGDLIIKTYGMLEQFFSRGETIVVVPVWIEGRLFVLPDFSVSTSAMSNIRKSSCYQSNSSFNNLRN